MDTHSLTQDLSSDAEQHKYPSYACIDSWGAYEVEILNLALHKGLLPVFHTLLNLQAYLKQSVNQGILEIDKAKEIYEKARHSRSLTSDTVKVVESTGWFSSKIKYCYTTYEAEYEILLVVVDFVDRDAPITSSFLSNLLLHIGFDWKQYPIVSAYPSLNQWIKRLREQ